MFQEIRSDDLLIHHHTSIVGNWSHAPDKENALDEPIERNHFCDVKREKLKHREAGVDNPVSQPFCVVRLVG